MIIGIDGNEANVDQQVGVSTYTLNLLFYFHKISDKNNQFIVYLREQPKEFLPSQTEFFSYSVVTGSLFWSQLFLPLRLFSQRKINVFFSPAHYAPRFCPVPSVVTIHDLSYFYYPNEFLKKDLMKLKSWTAYGIQKANKIIAVSKTTKKDIMKWYGTQDEKIEVIYNGYEKKVKSEKLKVKSLKEIECWKLEIFKYILYVGTLQPRKNIQTLVRAFLKWKTGHPDFKLVLAGKKGWLYEDIFTLVRELHLQNDVIFTGYVSDTELTKLYSDAFCFILPSLYEGFGIPVLEAMSFGCPVICSFTASLPEVGGDACLYIDPQNTDDIVEKLTALQNSDLRNELKKKGKARLKDFSWKRCGEETLKLLNSVKQQ